MKKTYYRDYCLEAFRFYAQVGGTQAYRQGTFVSAGELAREHARLERSRRTDTDEQIRAVKAALKDLEAVERTLARLKRLPAGEEAQRAVAEVYMLRPGERLAKGELSARVQRLALDLPAGERSIYYWLEQARDIFARERGLRI